MEGKVAIMSLLVFGRYDLGYISQSWKVKDRLMIVGMGKLEECFWSLVSVWGSG